MPQAPRLVNFSSQMTRLGPSLPYRFRHLVSPMWAPADLPRQPVLHRAAPGWVPEDDRHQQRRPGKLAEKETREDLNGGEYQAPTPSPPRALSPRAAEPSVADASCQTLGGCEASTQAGGGWESAPSPNGSMDTDASNRGPGSDGPQARIPSSAAPLTLGWLERRIPVS